MKMKNRRHISTDLGDFEVISWYKASYKEAHWQTILIDCIDNQTLCLICTKSKADALREHHKLVKDPMGYFDDEYDY